jgi:hypothetical protein
LGLEEELQPLPVKERSEMMSLTSTMPIWPDNGSVQVFEDTVVIKFGPYSYVQNKTICEGEKNLNTAIEVINRS